MQQLVGYPRNPIIGKRRVGDEWVVEVVYEGVATVSIFPTEGLADNYIVTVLGFSYRDDNVAQPPRKKSE